MAGDYPLTDYSAVYPASSGLRRKLNGKDEVNAKSIDEIP